MSFAWNFSKWAGAAPKGKTGIFVGGFMRATDKLFQSLDGTKREKIAQFKLLCLEALRRIQERTPVDTGNAKAGWRLEFVKDDDNGVKVTITNGVTYVVYLEYGWSLQAPRGMVRITLAEMAAAVRGESDFALPAAPPGGWRW